MLMACAANYGEGSYTLTAADGTVLASGSSFGASEATTVVLGAVAVPGCTDMAGL